MKIEINIELMKKIYGDEIEEIILNNMENIEKNINTLKEYKFEDAEGIFEMYPELIMNFPKQFKQKIEKMRKNYGENFVKIIEDDPSILETL